MNNVIVKNDVKIENMIYEIRGKQVMLDSDLARLYGCKNGTKSLNLAVKRNIERFPQDFYFQINKNEYDNLKFQIETSGWNMYGGVRKLPYVFTEQGVAMLATVLKTENASIVSVNIMRTFVVMKNYINTSLIEQKYFNELTIKNTEDIKLLKEEYSSIYSRFQIETLNKNNQKQGLNIKYLPYVFTEQGVAMLSAILKTDVAKEISIKYQHIP